MEIKTYFMCAVKFDDGTSLEFKRDSVNECLDRIRDLLEKHGPIKYLMINKFESVA